MIFNRFLPRIWSQTLIILHISLCVILAFQFTISQDAQSLLKHFSFADEISVKPDAIHSGSQIELETALEERGQETKQLERPYATPLEADVVMFKFQKILNQSATPSENFCVPWEINSQRLVDSSSQMESDA